tara:strand:+ start:130 stop:576 length:447 start_codon:yes stop_codon:yes gene_type:complete
MASVLKVNILTGVTTAGSIVVTGEGNSTTTNLQQGLAKAWTVINGRSFGTNDSFNQASATDHGVGDYTTDYTTDFSDADGSPVNALIQNIQDGSNFAGVNRGVSCYGRGNAPAAGTFRIITIENADADADGAAVDFDAVYITRHGDLA